MKQIFALWIVLISFVSFAQENAKEALYDAKSYLRDGNDAYENNNYEDAAILYQKSLDQQGNYYKGAYNLGNAYFQQKKYKEAVEQYQLAKSLAEKEEDKTKISELLGDSFKKQKDLENAVNAYKEALLKKPKDDILRQKYIAAKKAKQKQDQQNKDNKDGDDNKDNKDKGDQKKDGDDKKGDKNKKDKDGDQKDDKGEKNRDKEGDNKDKEEKGDQKDQNKESQGENEKQPAQQPKTSKLNPQQVQQLLENMSNEEQKTQKKVNAQQVKVKVNKNEKDW